MARGGAGAFARSKERRKKWRTSQIVRNTGCQNVSVIAPSIVFWLFQGKKPLETHKQVTVHFQLSGCTRDTDMQLRFREDQILASITLNQCGTTSVEYQLIDTAFFCPELLGNPVEFSKYWWDFTIVTHTAGPSLAQFQVLKTDLIWRCSKITLLVL